MFTFYLMTGKGYSVLETLIQKNHAKDIDAIVGARDKNIQKDYFDEIEALCRDNNIQFYERTKVPLISSQYSFAIGWRWLIENQNLIVLHDGLLPRYRGFAPLVNALINGEPEIGVTALFADKESDRGKIILQKKIQVSYPLKIEAAIRMISNVYIDITCELVAGLKQPGTLKGTDQNEQDASYSLWLDEEDYRINWQKDADQIARFIDAVGFPYKGASAMINNEIIRVTEAEQVADVLIENRVPGKVLFIQEGLPVVVCGRGLLKIKELIWENGTAALPLKNFRTRFR